MSFCTTDILSVASMSFSALAPVPLGRVAALPNGRSRRGFAARSALGKIEKLACRQHRLHLQD